jgi:hypothetical protein
MNHPSGLRFSPARQLKNAAIEETAFWPFEEASIIFKYILDRGNQCDDWDDEIIDAIDCLNEAAVDVILRKPGALPGHREPARLYDAVRARLIKAFPRGPDDSANQTEVTAWRKEHADICTKAQKIIGLIRLNYPDYSLGGTVLLNFADKIWSATFPEISVSRHRYKGGGISADKFGNEVENILRPWMAVMAAERASHQIQQLQNLFNHNIGQNVGLNILLDATGDGLIRHEGRILYIENLSQEDLNRQIQQRSNNIINRVRRMQRDIMLGSIFENLSVGITGDGDENQMLGAITNRAFEVIESDNDEK